MCEHAALARRVSCIIERNAVPNSGAVHPSSIVGALLSGLTLWESTSSLRHKEGKELEPLAPRLFVAGLQLECASRVGLELNVGIESDERQKGRFPGTDLRHSYVGNAQHRGNVLIEERLVKSLFCGYDEGRQQARLPVAVGQRETLLRYGTFKIDHHCNDARIWEIELMDNGLNVLPHHRSKRVVARRARSRNATAVGRRAAASWSECSFHPPEQLHCGRIHHS